MKSLVKLLIVVWGIGTSLIVNAAFLTSADYASIDVTPPAGWIADSSEVLRLVDGVMPTANPGSERFVGRRVGGAKLSVTNPYGITLNLIDTSDITSILLYNEWGNIFRQSVSSLTFTAFDAKGLTLFSDNLFGLATPGSFAPVSLFDGVLLGVKTLQFDVTSTNYNSSFEIREIQVNAQKVESAVSVSAPKNFAVLGFAGLCLFGFRKRFFG